MRTFFELGKAKAASKIRGMGSAFHQLCLRYSGTLTPTAPTAIRLWETFTYIVCSDENRLNEYKQYTNFNEKKIPNLQLWDFFLGTYERVVFEPLKFYCIN